MSNLIPFIPDPLAPRVLARASHKLVGQDADVFHFPRLPVITRIPIQGSVRQDTRSLIERAVMFHFDVFAHFISPRDEQIFVTRASTWVEPMIGAPPKESA